MFKKLLLIFVLQIILGGFVAWARKPVMAQASFTFAASGDIGPTSQSATQTTLNALKNLNPNFFLALGDLSYESVGTEQAWCNNIKSKLGANFPFEVVMGNHEDEVRENGYIGNFVKYCQDQLNVTGIYGGEYYFDYPKDAPLARIIMIGAANTWDYNANATVEPNENFTYNTSSSSNQVHYNWLSTAIDQARGTGIAWVIVGLHKNCITAATKSCEIGRPLLDLLVQKKVDLILQGHDHTYQRSKQMAFGTGCSTIPTGTANTSCLVDNGADNNYEKGKGTVLLINGTFGRGFYNVNTQDTEKGYFAKAMGGDGWVDFNGSGTKQSGASAGFTKYTISPSEIRADYVKTTNTTSTFNDSFVISNVIVQPTPTLSPTPTPTATGIPTLVPTPTPTASGSACSLPTDTGHADVTTTIDTAATYRVWSRIKADANLANSYWLNIGSNCYKVGDFDSIPEGQWVWVDYQNGDTTKKLDLTLAQGSLAMKLVGNEPGVQVDRVIFVSDPKCLPFGFGDNCLPLSTTTPTSSIVPFTNPPTATATSTPTTVPTPSPTPAGQLIFTPTHDAFVRADTPGVNYGKDTSLGVVGNPEKITYLKFDLTSLSGRVVLAAKLRLRVADASAETQNIKFVNNTSWGENVITYANKPVLTSTLIGAINGKVVDTWAEADLTNFIKTRIGKVTSIIVDSQGNDELGFLSKEGSAAFKPQLVIDVK